MHLVFSKVQQFDAGSPLVARIAEQKASLEQLVDMMESLKDNADVSAVRTDLIAIRSIFDQLTVVRSAHQGPSPSGRMVLGEDVSVSMTADKYAQLQQAVDSLRSRITTPEDTSDNA